MDERIPMIATTTKSSIKLKPELLVIITFRSIFYSATSTLFTTVGASPATVAQSF